MGETIPTWKPTCNPSVSVRLSGRKTSSDGGAFLLREITDRSGVCERLGQQLQDHRDPSKVRHSLRLLSETPLSDVQTLTGEPDEKGWSWLEAEVPNDQQTQWWIQGFGSAIDVVEPKSWREAIHQQAREVLGVS